MVSTFQINESELDNNFVKALKTLFKNRNITLTIEADEVDTTEYLLSNSVNKERLLKSVENVKKRKNLVKVDLDSLKALANA
jgi:retron-type reverse transcriptase